MKVFHFKNRKGNALLLSLLVMSGVIITGYTIGDLMLRDFAQTRRSDEAETAYYAAESGIEEGLYLLRKTDAALADLPGESTLPNNASYERAVSDSLPAIITSLERNDSMSIDFYDPDNALSGSGVDSLRIAWEDTCGGCSWLEIGYVEWTPATGVDWTENYVNSRYPVSASPVALGAFDPAKAYRLRLTANYGDVQNLTVNSFDESSMPVPIRHAIVTMTSSGKFGRTSQTLQATFVRQAPLQKIFDFVTFTECTLTKDGVPVCP